MPLPSTSWRKLSSCVFGQPPFEEGARVDAGGRVPLEVDEVAAEVLGGGAPEVVEPHVVQRGGGGEAGDVAAEIQVALAGAQHHRDRVPADDRAQPVLELVVARGALLEVRRDGVEVGRVGAVREVRPLAPRLGDELLEQVVGPFGTLRCEDALESVEPLRGFQGISVELAVHWRAPCYVKPRPDCVAESRGMSLCKHETCRASGRPHRRHQDRLRYTNSAISQSVVGRKTSIYVDSAGDSILAARDGAVSGVKRYGRRSLLFRELLRRYDEICRDAPDLADAEWSMLVAAGKTWGGQTDIRASTRWSHLLGAVNGNDGLARRLRDVGLAHQIAIVDYIERYWAAKARRDTLPPLPTRDGTREPREVSGRSKVNQVAR